MESIDLRHAIAYGNATFAELDKAVMLYEQLVEKLYALGEDVAARIDNPLTVADALMRAAEVHVQWRSGYRLAEKALLTACRILNSITPIETAKLARAYRFLGHVCCRQGKHRQSLKYNALAALLMLAPKDNSSTHSRGR